MANAAELIQRYKLTGAALVASAVVHAAVFVGMPSRLPSIDEPPGTAYSATLDPAAVAEAAAPAAPAPAPKPAARPHPKKKVAVPIPVPPAPEDVSPAAAMASANFAPEPELHEIEKIKAP